MLSGHEGASARCTHGTTCIGLSEAHPLLRHSVDVRSRDELLPIATEVTIAHVVTHYIYYIGMRLGKKRQRQRAEEQKGTPNLLLHREIAFIVGFYWTLLHGLRFSFANIQLKHELQANATKKSSLFF
jgi:hypothetical protein